MACRGLLVVGSCAASAAYYLPSRDRSVIVPLCGCLSSLLPPPASSCLLVLFGLALAVWLLLALALALLLSKRDLRDNDLSELPAGIFDNLGDLGFL